MRVLLDHSSGEMTAHYARLHDSTVRRHWENARKVNTNGEIVTIEPDGPLAEANWAKQRLGRVTQALAQRLLRAAGAEDLPTCQCLPDMSDVRHHRRIPAQPREHRQQLLQIVSAAEARGQHRLVEMNQQVSATSTTSSPHSKTTPTQRSPPMRADNSRHIIAAARQRRELTRAKAIQALRTLDNDGALVTF